MPHYRPPRYSGLVAPVPKRAAKILLALLPADAELRARTRLLPAEARTEFFATIDTLRAAAREYDHARRDNAASGTTSAPALVPAGHSKVGAEKLLSVGEAAGLLNLSTRRVRQLLYAGQLRGNKHGTQWLIPASAVSDYQQMKGSA